VRIMSLNINKYRNLIFQGKTFGKVFSLIQEVKPDVVFFQEIINKDNKRKIDSHGLELLADSTWYDYRFHKNATYSELSYGNAIISRFPIVEDDLLNISTNTFEQRGCLYSKIKYPKDGKFHNIHLFCTHLNLLKKSRLKQVALIKKFILSKVNTHEAIVLGGDFNDWDKSTQKFLLGIFSESEIYFQKQGIKSFPSIFPLLPLDKLYVHNLEILSEKSIKGFLSSDHLPIILDVSAY